MKTFDRIIVVSTLLALGAVLGQLSVSPVKAQNPAITPLQYTFSSSAAVHTDCAVTAGVTNYCFAFDGVWQSLNGAAYVQLTPGSTGASLTVTATAPLTATTSGSTVTLALPSTALKTAVDGLGLTAAAAPVQ